jgi:hypothetical protein
LRFLDAGAASFSYRPGNPRSCRSWSNLNMNSHGEDDRESSRWTSLSGPSVGTCIARTPGGPRPQGTWLAGHVPRHYNATWTDIQYALSRVCSELLGNESEEKNPKTQIWRNKSDQTRVNTQIGNKSEQTKLSKQIRGNESDNTNLKKWIRTNKFEQTNLNKRIWRNKYKETKLRKQRWTKTSLNNKRIRPTNLKKRIWGNESQETN